MPPKEYDEIDIGEMRVKVIRKAIRSFRIGVYPPDGEVRVSAPFFMGADAIRAALDARMDWIRKHRERLRSRGRPEGRRLEPGDSVRCLGKTFRLEITESARPRPVRETGDGRLALSAKIGSTAAERESQLYEWYRDELKKLIPVLLEKWERILGVGASAWGIRRMRTRWGSCNTAARRVWFNLELAKKPLPCVEYVVAHELAHLLERSHGKRFKAIMDRCVPDWRELRKTLNEEA